MKPKKDFLIVLDQVKEIVYKLRPEHMDLPTPDSVWTVRALVHHMLYELCWVPDIIMGETIEHVGDRYDGNLLGNDVLSAWRSAAIAAREAVHRCDPDKIAHLSYGDVSTGHYLRESATDQLVHAWDLAQALNVALVFNEVMAREMFERMNKRRTELLASGLFARPVHVPAQSDYQTKLLALLGRSTTWRTTL